MRFVRSQTTEEDRLKLFYRDKSIFLGFGIDLMNSYNEAAEDDEIEVWLDRRERGGHTLVIGTTGSGKTVLLSNLVKSDILAGHRIVYVDPKGDTDLFKTFVSYSKMCGRFNPETFMFLSPMYLEHSIELNPLWGLDADEAAVVLVSSIPDGREPFFKKVSFMVLLAIMFSLSSEKEKSGKGKDDYPSIYDVAQYFSLDKLKFLQETVTSLLEKLTNTKNSKLAGYSNDAKLVLEHLTAADASYFEKVTMTLKAEIDVLVTGAVGQIIGRAKTNRLIERLVNNQDVIFLAYLGALRYGDDIVGRGARMIFSSIQRLAGKMYQRFDYFDPPLSVYGDEAKNLFYDGIEDLFNKVRGAKIMLTFATQSLGDIAAALGADKMSAIVGNTNIQIFMRSVDKMTTEYIEDMSEEVYVYRPNFMQHTLGLNQTKQKAVLSASLKRLKTGSFFAVVYGQWYQIYSPYQAVVKHLDFDPFQVFFDSDKKGQIEIGHDEETFTSAIQAEESSDSPGSST